MLIVDDSEANRRFGGFVARRLGCIFASVSDGDEVTEAVMAAAEAGTPYDIVLMDLVMVRARCGALRGVPPCVVVEIRRGVRVLQVRMNGDTALAALRAAGSHVPVAAVTANATPADAERYAAQGFVGVMGKPFTQAQMAALLVHALR